MKPKQDRSVATRLRILDAALEELLATGYAGLTASAVAQRARVSRGAQQHHFPTKQLLVAEAVRHLAARQVGLLRQRVAATPVGRDRARRALDVLFELYSGPLFAATVELSLAADHDPDLRPFVTEHERAISHEISAFAADVFDPKTRAGAAPRDRWSLMLATVRGVAMLRILGHPAPVVERQWRLARRELVTLLELDAAPHARDQAAAVTRGGAGTR